MEEENRFYALSSIPAIVVSTILAVCYGFGHLTQLPSGTPIMWDLLWNFIIPVVSLAPVSSFLACEILTLKKEKSGTLHVKRFAGRMAILLVCTLLLIFVYLLSYLFLAPLISERFAVLSTLLMWLLILMVGLVRFKALFSKLEKGRW
jgi:hypothetical protein